MHDALLIPEVLGNIFNHLAADTMRCPGTYYAMDTRKSGRRALAVLARTCRAFSEPALDAVWHRLHSLRPLMQCLPANASSEDTPAVGASLLFNEDDWDIVSRYAPRVQELTLEREPLSLDILQHLWFRTTLLLPNLRKLHWSYEDHTAIGAIRLLLSPSLVHLHVWLDDGGHSSVLGLLEHYHTLCPNLRSLYFGHSCRLPHVTAAISRAVCRSPNLETLKCDFIDEKGFIRIAGSPRLKQFSANLFNYRPDDLRRLADCGLFDRPLFENLRALRLHLQDLSSIIPYLNAYHQPFENIFLNFHDLPVPGVFHALFTALSSATRLGTLRRISLVSDSWKGEKAPSHLVDFRVLSPLMGFNLQELDFKVDNPISLSDDELARLAQAWPELETFHFRQHSPWEDQLSSFPGPTLRGLLLLVARCPKLRELGMDVDATKIPSLSTDESLVYNTTITRLVLANSPIQEPVDKVAQFLLDHFPSLAAQPTALVCFHDDPSHRRMWREVSQQIEGLHGGSSSSERSDSD